MLYDVQTISEKNPSMSAGYGRNCGGFHEKEKNYNSYLGDDLFSVVVRLYLSGDVSVCKGTSGHPFGNT